MPESSDLELVPLQWNGLPGLLAPRLAKGGSARARTIGTLAVVLFFAAWQLAGSISAGSALFISSPGRVVQAGLQLVRTGELWVDFRTTVVSYLLGLALSIGVGIPLGVLLGWYRTLEAVLEPYIAALMAAPRIIFFPLIIIWLGTGRPSIVFVVFLMSVFDVLVNTSTGVRQLDATLIRAAHSFGASSRQIFTTLALPASVPYIVTGLRLAAGTGLIGVVVGELWIGQAGIGVMLTTAGQRLRAADIYFGVFVLIAIGLTVSAVLERVERRFQSWRS